MVAIQATELVFLVEPDGDTSLAIVSGGVSVALEGQRVEAAAEDGRVTLLTFAADVPGLFEVQSDAVANTYQQIDVAFEQPSAYSSAVAKYKASLAKDGILNACVDGQSCEAAVETLGLAELGVDKADVTASLNDLRDALDNSSNGGSTVIDQVLADVELSMCPKSRALAPAAAGPPSRLQTPASALSCPASWCRLSRSSMKQPTARPCSPPLSLSKKISKGRCTWQRPRIPIAMF